MTPGSPKPEAEDSAATGASAAEAERPVDFEPDRGAKPGKGKDPKDQPPDAAERLGTKRRDGEKDETNGAPPGAVSPENLTTESDDGAS